MANLGQGENSLYKVLDVVERIKDQVESIEKERGALIESKTKEMDEQARELGAANESLRAEVEELKAQRDAAQESGDSKLKEIEERCNRLDELLPRGEKVYTTGERSKDEDLAAFGRAFTVARRAKNGDALPEDYKRAQTIGTTTVTNDTAGGTLVPIETHDAVVRIIGEKSLARTICRQVSMTSSEMIVPIVDAGPTVYWPAEGSAPTESSVSFADDTDAQLKAKTLTAYDSISRELDEDSLVALEPFFAEVFGDAIAKEENNQLLTGTGSPFTGVGQVTNLGDVTGVSTFTTSFDKLQEVMFSVGSNVVNNGTWVMNMKMLGEIVGLTATTTGAPLFASAWGNGGLAGVGSNLPNPSQGLAGFLMGRPVYVSDTMPSAAGSTGDRQILFGDFNHVIFGDRRALSVEFDDSVFFASRERCMLVYERIGILVNCPSSSNDGPTFAAIKQSA